ncbi:MAG: peptidoglycan-binding protein [Patescibacteria group bacterium]
MKKLLPTLIITLSLPLLLGAATVSDIELRIASLLSELQILQTELQNLKSGEAAVSVVEVQTSPSATFFTTTLGKGSEGSDVTKLQQYLAKDGTLYPEGLITGYYGSLTEAAVKRFQQKHNIVSSGTPLSTGYGTVGPKTRTTLNSLLATPLELTAPTEPSSNGASPNTPAPNRSPNLSITGDRVVFLPNGASLSGLATDDGVPGVPLAYFWKKASGPGSVIFSSLNTKDTIAAFSSPGTYQITLTVSDGDLFATYTIAVLVKAALSTPTPLPPPAPVTPPTSTPTLSFSATSSSLTKGESVTITWSTTNVSTCTAGEGWSGTKAASGSVVFSPTQTTTYTLLCTGTEGDTIAKEITITVTEPPPPTPPPSTTPTLSFSANTTTLTQGQSTTLTWVSTNTTSCTASGGWTGTKSLQGSSAKIPSQTTTYTLTCMNATNESVSKNVTVTVTAPSTSSSVLGISGDKFTINGTPTFLLGVSYFDALDWRTSDLDGLHARGFNLIRIFLDWKTDNGNDAESIFDMAGNLKPTETQTIRDLIHASATQGIIVDITILHALSVNLLGSDMKVAIRNAVSAFGTKPNVFFDLVNEHNCGSWSRSHSAMGDLMNTARSAAPNAIITFSSACEPHILTGGWNADGGNINGEVATGIDLIAPHFLRVSNWYDRVDQNVAAVKAYLSSVGSLMPVYVQEENRNGYDGGYFTVAELIQAAVEAHNAGAAGYIFHTAAGFDLSSSSFFDNLDSVERGVVDGLSAAVF